MSDEIKAMRDEAKTALEAVNQTVNELKKSVDPLVEEKLARINADFDKKYETWESKLKAAEEASKKADERADKLEARMAKMRPADGEAKGRDALSDQDRKHLDAFESFVRKGDAAALEDAMTDAPAHIKRLSTDDMASGGYLVAPEFIDAEVSRIVSETSPVRQFASVQVISGTDAFKKNVNVGGSAASWEDQDTAASVENTNPSFREIRIPINGLRAVYHASPNMIDDTRVSIEQLFAQEMAVAIAETENPAFVSGNGVGKPRGFLSYTKTLTGSYAGEWESVETFVTGADGAFKAAGSAPEAVFLDTIHSLKAPYSPNARFYLNRGSLASVRKIRDADGRPLFMWDGTMPASIAGEPYTIFQDMPDIASDSYSIAYGDMRAAYQIVDRAGLTVLRDPFSSKPNVEFFGRKRVGGGMKMFEALKLIQFAD